MNISSLSENTRLRYVSFTALYFSQGIPEGITLFCIPAWMAMNGKSASEIAAFSALILLPFSFKILLAPIIDRYTFLQMGRRKPWILFGQFGIAAGLFAMSFISNPLNNISLLTIAAVCVHVFIMCQDIATDSLVIDIVPIGEQGKANSLMWGGKTVGTSLSLFVGSWMINYIGFATTLRTMSALIIAFMFVPLILRERKGEKLLPWLAGKTSPDAAFLMVDSWSKIFTSFKSVMLLKNSLLLTLSVFITMAAVHYLRTLLPVFMIQHLGWNNVKYSNAFSIFTLVGGLIGMLTGGILINRLGIVKMIQVNLFYIAVLVTGLVVSSSLWLNTGFMTAFIALFCTLVPLIYIGVLALAMHMCWRRISAVHFTFCMTVFNTGLAAGAAMFGFLRTFCGWTAIFLGFIVMIGLVMMIMSFIKTNQHREHVELLELKYVDILHKESDLLAKADVI